MLLVKRRSYWIIQRLMFLREERMHTYASREKNAV